MEMPEWWLTASGLFFILGSVALIVITVLCGVMIWAVLDLSRKVKELNERVKTLSTKVESIVDTAKDVTTDVGARAKGIVRVVDDQANAAFDLIEKFGPILMVLGIGAKLFNMFKSKKQVS